jgi:hypothetical protein
MGPVVTGRLDGWETRLIDLIAARRTTPFAYGAQDCALWPADAVLALTGRDMAAPYRGTYDDARGALRLIVEHGGLAALCEAMLDRAGILWQRLDNIRFAQRGDIVILAVAGDETGRDAGGVVWLHHVYTPGPRGLDRFPLVSALRGWRIG